MKLSIWIAKQGNQQGLGKTAVLRNLAELSDVSLLTLQIVERGGQMNNYKKAKAVSEATKGKVKIIDLCEG